MQPVRVPPSFRAAHNRRFGEAREQDCRFFEEMKGFAGTRYRPPSGGLVAVQCDLCSERNRRTGGGILGLIGTANPTVRTRKHEVVSCSADAASSKASHFTTGWPHGPMRFANKPIACHQAPSATRSSRKQVRPTPHLIWMIGPIRPDCSRQSKGSLQS